LDLGPQLQTHLQPNTVVVFYLLILHYSFLTLNQLTWKIWWTPNNASRWQMGFNSAFKGL